MSSVLGCTSEPLSRTRAPKTQATPARKRLGQDERRSRALVARWIGAITANSPKAAAMRATARAFGRGLAVAIERDAVELHAMVDEAEAEFLRDPLLQGLELIVDELENIARLDVDQMVVVRLRRRFVT